MLEDLKEVLQHGDSILGSVILCETFRRISHLWDNAHTLNLENCRLYLSSTIPQFFYFIRCMVFYLFSIAWKRPHSIVWNVPFSPASRSFKNTGPNNSTIGASVLEVIKSQKLQRLGRCYKHEAFPTENTTGFNRRTIPWKNTFSLRTNINGL